MAQYGFWYRSGPWELGKDLTQASSALVPGDSMVNASGTLDIGTTSNKIIGSSLGTKLVGDSATTAVSYVKNVDGRVKFLAWVVSGTLATTEAMSRIDLAGASGAQGIAADTTTNSDLYVDKVLAAGTASAPQGHALVKFADPSYLNATN